MEALSPVLLAILAGPAASAVLVVNVDPIDSDRGQILVAVHNTPDTWRRDGDFKAPDFQAYRWRIVPARKPAARVEFRDLPAGTYAVSIVHDENGDGRLNHQVLPFAGIPDEPYAISNGAWSMFRKGDFGQAAFPLGEGGAEVTLRLKTHRQRIQDGQ